MADANPPLPHRRPNVSKIWSSVGRVFSSTEVPPLPHLQGLRVVLDSVTHRHRMR
jgi:hypothetical protein